MDPIQPGVATSAQRPYNERDADQGQSDGLATVRRGFATRAPLNQAGSYITKIACHHRGAKRPCPHSIKARVLQGCDERQEWHHAGVG
jgi:hypothetical protein